MTKRKNNHQTLEKGSPRAARRGYFLARKNHAEIAHRRTASDERGCTERDVGQQKGRVMKSAISPSWIFPCVLNASVGIQLQRRNNSILKRGSNGYLERGEGTRGTQLSSVSFPGCGFERRSEVADNPFGVVRTRSVFPARLSRLGRINGTWVRGLSRAISSFHQHDGGYVETSPT